MAGAHAAMIMVMVMTPLHMAHGGADLEIIGVVISVLLLGEHLLASMLIGGAIAIVGVMMVSRA